MNLISFFPPDFSWSDLIIAVVSAVVGYFARHFQGDRP